MKAVDFLFVYEVRNRELDSICLLGAYLRSRSYSVAYINSWKSFYEKAQKYKAEVVVVSACYNDDIYDYFTGHADSFQKVVNLQWEEIDANWFYENDTSNNNFYSGISLKTRHLCWGENNREWLHKRYGVDNKCLFVKGYLPLDFYRNDLMTLMIPRKELFERYGLNHKKKTILFVSSFAHVGLPADQMEGYIDQIVRGMEKACIETQPIMMSWFSRIARINPDMQIVYRFHPAEKNNSAILEMAKDIPNFFAISDESIRHWIAACDKLYNWFSTSMIEMYASKKDTYVLRPVKLPHYIDAPIFNHCHFLTTYEEFEQSVFETQSRDDFPIPKEELLKWYSIEDAPAYQRIGAWLIATLHDRKYTSRPSKANIHHPRPWSTLKKKIKHSPMFWACSRLIIEHSKANMLTERLAKSRESVKKEREYQKHIADENGYIRSRYYANYVFDEELNAKLDQYEAIIRENSNTGEMQ